MIDRGRIVIPKLVWDPEIGTTFVLCTLCGAQMKFEIGGEIGIRARHEWAWWRCIENPKHITRAIPFPVQMARG